MNPDELQADIERTRKELGSTLDELTATFDVRARAQHAVEPVNVRVALAAAAGVVLVLVIVRLRRRSRRHA